MIIAIFRLSLVSVLLMLSQMQEAAYSEAFKTATFSMYCYWTGEATLGRVPGILSSRIGHMSGAGEIVQVDYDPGQVNLAELVSALKRQGSFYAFIARDENEASEAKRVLSVREIKISQANPHFIDSKHSLRVRYPELLKFDLTEEQAIKLNSWAYFGGKMPDVLTAAQKAEWKHLGT